MDPKYEAYLEALRQSGNTAAAREAAGLTADQLGAAFAEVDGFTEACEHARAMWRHSIEQALKERAIDGVEEPIYWNGQVVGTKLVYSDSLLALMAKANLKAYREKVEVSEAPPAQLDVDSLSPESQELMSKILAIEEKRRGGDQA